MASAGENLNASQFYITTADDMDSLDEKHTIFGQVGSGGRAGYSFTLLPVSEPLLGQVGKWGNNSD